MGRDGFLEECWNWTHEHADIIRSQWAKLGISLDYDKENGNRGVKYSNGALGETRMPKFGILVEVAHHDYLEDAKWIMDNKELIGNTIADSCLNISSGLRYNFSSINTPSNYQ